MRLCDENSEFPATTRNNIAAVIETSGRPSREEFEKMARRRFQNPKPHRLGRWWYILINEDVIIDGRRIRKRKRVKLAPEKTPMREVQKIAAEYLMPFNQGLLTVGSAVKFADYVEVYKKTEMKVMVDGGGRYAGIIRNYLVPTFGELPLRELT